MKQVQHIHVNDLERYSMAPIRLKIGNSGRMANKMFQYEYCRNLQAALPNSELCGINLPEFGLVYPGRELQGRVLHLKDGHRYSFASLAYQLSHGIYDGLLFDGYVQRLEYYPNRDVFGSHFNANLTTDRTHLGVRNITVHIRGDDALRNAHPDYNPVDISFYERVVEVSGLEPVIMGQLGDDPYSVEIRRRFSGCTFLPSISAIHDFEIIRNSTNIALSVSTFSWLAAWLSRTATNIYLPIRGILHPKQRPDIDLLPTRDERYHFYEFEVEKWEASPSQLEALLAKSARFQQVDDVTVRSMIK